MASVDWPSAKPKYVLIIEKWLFQTIDPKSKNCRTQQELIGRVILSDGNETYTCDQRCLSW